MEQKLKTQLAQLASEFDNQIKAQNEKEHEAAKAVAYYLVSNKKNTYDFDVFTFLDTNKVMLKVSSLMRAIQAHEHEYPLIFGIETMEITAVFFARLFGK